MGLDIYFESKKTGNEVAYFRKLNFLLPYFRYEENCSRINIDEEEIKNFIDDARKLIEKWENKDKDFEDYAKEMIPTKSGFFFGATEYGEWYIEELKEAVRTFEAVLMDFDFENDTLEMYCWW